MSKRRVAVVGAGISGLAALKSCLEEGLDAVCFEQHGDIGGTWYTTDEFRPGQNARIYDSLILNTSKAICSFSDFPFPEDAAPYPTGSDMYPYLKSYAEHFDLLKHVRLNTSVRKIKKSAEYDRTGSWDVETEVDGTTSLNTFDAVMVCTGFYTEAYTPSIDGLDSFKGTVEHSQTFKSGIKYKDKRILVVGNSNSAGDVAVDTSRFAKQVILRYFYKRARERLSPIYPNGIVVNNELNNEVHLSLGKGTWVINRCQEYGLPLDFALRRIFTILPFQGFLTSRTLVKKCSRKFDHTKANIRPMHSPPKGAVMINDEIQMRITCGKIRISGNLARMGERHAEFKDGTRINNLDGVIFATGLTRQTSRLNPMVAAHGDKLEWYKDIFPLEVEKGTFAVIGFFRTLGSVVPIAELQARLAARVFAGKHQLPPADVMRRNVDKWNKHMIDTHGCYKNMFPNIAFGDELAAEIGCKPTFLDLWKLGPVITYQYYFGPSFSVHHRLVGPGAWAGAVRACAAAQRSGYANQIRKPPSYDTAPILKQVLCFLALFVTLMIGLLL